MRNSSLAIGINIVSDSILYMSNLSVEIASNSSVSCLWILKSLFLDDCSKQNTSESSFILSESDFALQGGEAIMVCLP